MDDLVAQIGELDHKLDKLNHKRRVAADMIAGLKRSNDIQKDVTEYLQLQVNIIPSMENTICLLTTKVHTQAGEIESLKWTIKELTKK